MCWLVEGECVLKGVSGVEDMVVPVGKAEVSIGGVEVKSRELPPAALDTAVIELQSLVVATLTSETIVWSPCAPPAPIAVVTAFEAEEGVGDVGSAVVVSGSRNVTGVELMLLVAGLVVGKVSIVPMCWIMTDTAAMRELGIPAAALIPEKSELLIVAESDVASEAVRTRMLSSTRTASSRRRASAIVRNDKRSASIPRSSAIACSSRAL
jgi:hypothetical protein